MSLSSALESSAYLKLTKLLNPSIDQPHVQERQPSCLFPPRSP